MSDTLGGRIAEARKARKRTQEWLGEKTSTNRGTVVAWEKPNGNPSGKNLQQIVAALGVSGHWLITGEGMMYNVPSLAVKTIGRMEDVLRDYIRAAKDPQDIPGIGFCSFDTELRFIEINPWLANVNGLSIAEHKGKKLREILPAIAKATEGQLQHVLDTGESIINGLAQVGNEPGVEQFYRHDYYAVRKPDQTIVGVRCVVREILPAMDQL